MRQHSAVRGSESIALSFGESSHQPLAYTAERPSDYDEVARQRLDLIGLPPEYDQLAWSAFMHMRSCVLAEVGDDPRTRRSYTSATSSAHFGVRLMARYLSYLPLVYAWQRDKFGQRPAAEAAQLSELQAIGERSLGPLEVAAALPMPICGELEKTSLTLRGSYGGSIAAGANYAYKMRQTPQGLCVQAAWGLEEKATTIASTFEASQGKPVRGLGCIALRVADAVNGDSTLKTVWRRLLTTAVHDPNLFAAALRSEQEYYAGCYPLVKDIATETT